MTTFFNTFIWGLHHKAWEVWEVFKKVDFVQGMGYSELKIKEDEGFKYSPTYPPVMRLILNGLNITEKDVFVDFGCGKGLAIKTAINYPFDHLIGVDLSEEICKIAFNNGIRLGWGGRVQIVCANAAFYDIPDDATYFFFYNPFPESIFKQVIKNIEISSKKNNRQVTLIYRNPRFDNVISDNDYFVIIKTIEPNFYSSKPINIYRNKKQI